MRENTWKLFLAHKDVVELILISRISYSLSMFWILAKTKSSHILFYLHYMFIGFPLNSYQIPAKLTPLFFMKASNVETSWLKRCWLILREADVQTFQQKPNVPHHLHSGAALQAFSSFPGHFLAQLDLVLALQSPCTFCLELAEASTCSEWSWMAASWRECLSKNLTKSLAETGEAQWLAPRFSKGMLWTMDHGCYLDW